MIFLDANSALTIEFSCFGYNDADLRVSSSAKLTLIDCYFLTPFASTMAISGTGIVSGGEFTLIDIDIKVGSASCPISLLPVPTQPPSGEGSSVEASILSASNSGDQSSGPLSASPVSETVKESSGAEPGITVSASTPKESSGAEEVITVSVSIPKESSGAEEGMTASASSFPTSPSVSSAEGQSAGLSTGAIVGVSVGVVAALAVVIGICVVIRARANRETSGPAIEMPTEEHLGNVDSTREYRTEVAPDWNDAPVDLSEIFERE